MLKLLRLLFYPSSDLFPINIEISINIAQVLFLKLNNHAHTINF